MRLGEAAAAFFEHLRQAPAASASEPAVSQLPAPIITAALTYAIARFPDEELDDLTPARWRDWLARDYVEEATAQRLATPSAAAPASPSFSPSASSSPPSTSLSSAASQPQFVEPAALFDSLKLFLIWAGQTLALPDNREHLRLLDELRETVPRAIAMAATLAAVLAERGGAFGFAEFLTSFEEGGQSDYDISEVTTREDGGVNFREGYFRILSIEDQQISAEDLLDEERLAPILFPAKVAPLVAKDYILNLELARTPDGWQVINCGFAYPPEGK